MKTLVCMLIPLVLAVILWVVNVVKFTNCDFQAPYRCEVIHAVGLVPPIQLITVWFPSDEK